MRNNQQGRFELNYSPALNQARAVSIDPEYSEAQRFFLNKHVNPNDFQYTSKKRN